jgi:hypothetical protein
VVDDLKQLLIDILWDERAREIDNDLPEVAAVPVMKRKTFKELGTPITDGADGHGNVIKELSPEELLKLAEEERVRLEKEGEIDRVGDAQPEKPPPIDDSIIGTQLEICWRCASALASHVPSASRARTRSASTSSSMNRDPRLRAAASLVACAHRVAPRSPLTRLSRLWSCGAHRYEHRYWREPTAERKAKGDKRKKIGVKMWCEGEVVLVANGTTTTENGTTTTEK